MSADDGKRIFMKLARVLSKITNADYQHDCVYHRDPNHIHHYDPYNDHPKCLFISNMIILYGDHHHPHPFNYQS